MAINKVILIGNLGRDPDVRLTDDGRYLATFSLATNAHYVDQHGHKQVKTTWHNIVAWRKMAERCSKLLKKGSKVFIEGKISTSTWKDQDGITHSKSDIKIDQMHLFWSPKDDGSISESKIDQKWPESIVHAMSDDSDDIPF